MHRSLSLACILVAVLSSCRKDEHLGGGGILLGAPLQISMDSLCVQAPNVFTPNGDAIDDVFHVFLRNAALFSVTIRNAEDSVVYTSIDQNHLWDGIDHTVNDSLPTPGPYHFAVQVTGTSGAQLSGSSTVYVVPDLASPCFSTVVAPVFGSQFDPRICGPVYATNDTICMQ